MTKVGRVYGEALYALACDEDLRDPILHQLNALDTCFTQEPDFLRLLSAPNLPKAQCREILNDCFQDKAEPYVLNFLKILTEKGYIRYFGDCVAAYRNLYNRDNGILPVTAVTAIALTAQQTSRLTEKLHSITGRRIALTNRLDPSVLGGIRLELDGKRVDGTAAHRLDALGGLLKNTTL